MTPCIGASCLIAWLRTVRDMATSPEGVRVQRVPLAEARAGWERGCLSLLRVSVARTEATRTVTVTEGHRCMSVGGDYLFERKAQRWVRAGIGGGFGGAANCSGRSGVLGVPGVPLRLTATLEMRRVRVDGSEHTPEAYVSGTMLERGSSRFERRGKTRVMPLVWMAFTSAISAMRPDHVSTKRRVGELREEDPRSHEPEHDHSLFEHSSQRLTRCEQKLEMHRPAVAHWRYGRPSQRADEQQLSAVLTRTPACVCRVGAEERI